jgi:superkiller protein 3
MGNAYGKKENFNRAIECFEKAIEINPDDANVYYNLGLVYRVKGNNEKGIGYIQKAARLGNRAAQVYLRKNRISW